ncbi:MAG TPA: hypothetical protein VNO79_07825 [Actinomycetota bacterium]|nr:hypothetical protein [Actinomycetota bacterium]
MTDRIDALLRRIDLEGARHRLDRALRTARRLRPTGRVLLPRDDDTSVVEVLLAGLSDDEREAVDELTYEEVLDHVLEKGWNWEVYCENPSSMVSGEWGFGSFELGPRGYFFEVPDMDEPPECPYRLLGAWEPVTARAAYEAAWVEVYVAWWDVIVLPPMRGELADGPRPLMLRALERILGEDDAAWAAAIREAVDVRYLELGDLIEWTADETGLTLGIVEAVVRGAVEGVAAEVPADLRRRILREAYLNTW